MSRSRLAAALALMAAGFAGAQQNPNPQLPPDEDASPKSAPKQEPNRDPKAAPQQPYRPPSTADLPPDEDAATNTPEKVTFNPVQSEKDVMVGTEYFKKGNYKAAADRFRSATQRNDSNAKAWLMLGEAEEKRESPKDARDAYQRYLALAPTSKNAAEIKKKLEKLK